MGGNAWPITPSDPEELVGTVTRLFLDWEFKRPSTWREEVALLAAAGVTPEMAADAYEAWETADIKYGTPWAYYRGILFRDAAKRLRAVRLASAEDPPYDRVALEELKRR